MPYQEEKKEWIPRTQLGKRVMGGEFGSLDEVLGQGNLVLEAGIVDHLVPTLKEEVVLIGGSPGKGGGAKRTPTRRTSRMHKSGRRMKMTAMIAVGNGAGLFGIGKSGSRENRIALQRAVAAAKLNMTRVRLGCGSWECRCGGTHSIPFKVYGRSGSVRVRLLPAPKGVGIVASSEVKKMLQLAGIKDVWAKLDGQTSTRINLAQALFAALKALSGTKGGI